MLNFDFLLAANPGGWLPFVMIGAIILLFVFTSRKQRTQDRKDAEMRDGLQVGDEVTTIGGIIGKVVSIKAETFVLETTKDKTKIRFLKGAIRSVDVRAADIAASIIETSNEPAVSEEPVEAAAAESAEADNSKKKKKK